jgi:hypothetical protein
MLKVLTEKAKAERLGREILALLAPEPLTPERVLRRLWQSEAKLRAHEARLRDLEKVLAEREQQK